MRDLLEGAVVRLPSHWRVAILALFTAAASHAADAPAGRIVVVETDLHRVEIFTPGGELVARFPTGLGPRGLAERDGKLFVANSGVERAPGSSLSVIDLASLTAERTVFLCEACGPRGVAFDAGGALWVAAEAPPALIELPPPYTRRGRTVALPEGAPGDVAASGPGRTVVVTLRGAGGVATVDGASGAVRRIAVGAAPGALAGRPGAAEVWVVPGPEGELAVVRPGAAAGEPPDRRTGPTFAQDLDFTPDGEQVLITAARDRSLAVLDPADGRTVGRIQFDAAPKELAVSPDGRRAAVFLPLEGQIVIVRLDHGAPPERENVFAVEASVVELLWRP